MILSFFLRGFGPICYDRRMQRFKVIDGGENPQPGAKRKSKKSAVMLLCRTCEADTGVATSTWIEGKQGVMDRGQAGRHGTSWEAGGRREDVDLRPLPRPRKSHCGSVDVFGSSGQTFLAIPFRYSGSLDSATSIRPSTWHPSRIASSFPHQIG